MQVQCWRENVRLRSENESLAADIAELRQEMEEMHDQYREEEIEEFRELQRELEQNAKNCRILQFKLRKAERERDHLQTEKNVIGCKLRELRSSQQPPNPQAQPSAATTTIPFPATGAPAAARLSAAKELESELRIAKEVSG
jgi:chromosome segregation ATPase